MNQYKINKITSDKAKESLSTGPNITVISDKYKEELLNKLKDFNSSFTPKDNVKLPESPTFERMKDVEINDDEIRQNAETELGDYKNKSINNINDSFENKRNELNNNIQSLNDTVSTTKENVASAYQNARETASNDALKRGLSRSSIVINTLDALTHDELEMYNQIDKELSNNLNAINFELNALSSSYEEALNNFDIEYASKLQERINSTKEKLKAEQEKVIKYNNEIAEKEAEFNRELAELEEKFANSNFDNNLDILELYGKYGSLVVEKFKANRMYDLANNYFADLPSDQVYSILTTSPEFKSLLGEDNYNKLLKAYAPK